MIPMPEQHVTVTAAARGFSDLVNRVRYLGESAVLVKNGAPVARIVPFVPEPKRPSAADLARRLIALQLPPDDVDRFAVELSLARATLGLPTDPD